MVRDVIDDFLELLYCQSESTDEHCPSNARPCHVESLKDKSDQQSCDSPALSS